MNYGKHWRKYRMFKILAPLGFALEVPIMFLAVPWLFKRGYIGSVDPKTSLGALAAFLTPVFVGSLFADRLLNWPCPRCGQRFSDVSWPVDSKFLPQCAHNAAGEI
jgi:hypothetical protein